MTGLAESKFSPGTVTLEFSSRKFEEDSSSPAILCVRFEPDLAAKEPAADVLKSLDGALLFIAQLRADVLRERK
jgi:hypothetical protein